MAVVGASARASQSLLDRTVQGAKSAFAVLIMQAIRMPPDPRLIRELSDRRTDESLAYYCSN